MKLGRERVLDRLVADEPCLGAVFTAFAFDPKFFEEHVLRSVLRLAADPEEDAGRFHGEARRALQETPVVAIVDAHERQAGRRLPYDVLDVAQVVFHPKSALLLYRERARLLVGSGNLTHAGYGGNTEIFLVLDLAYGDPTGAALLATFDAHLARVATLPRQSGTQLKQVRAELARRLPADLPSHAAVDVELLDSFQRPIMEKVLECLPDGAKVERVGMLAPFYERDDGGRLDGSSVFGAMGDRLAADAILDVGASWENAEVRPGETTSSLEEGLGALWAWTIDGGNRVEYLVPRSIGAKTLSYTDDRGTSKRHAIDDARDALDERVFWQLPRPKAFAPAKTISASRELFADVRTWLHPATQLDEGRPVHRRLHAKLLVVSYRVGKAEETIVMLGSPNMSRRALLAAVDPDAGPGGGNVELAVVMRLSGSWQLCDLVPELVLAPPELADLGEHEFPELPENLGLAIERAVHDPAAQTLTVEWTDRARDLRDWRLTYVGNELAGGGSAPTADVRAAPFELLPASAEVVLHANGGEFAVPILVTDLVALPAGPSSRGLGLEELLLLLGRRVGAERAIQMAESRLQKGDADDGLESIFGEDFGPTDVFRAWWAVVADLAEPSLSVTAFRLRLEGPLAVGAAWAQMLEAVQRGRVFRREHAWLYGAELLRTLADLEVPPGPDRDAKLDLLKAFTTRVRADLRALTTVGEAIWLQKVRSFYSEQTEDGLEGSA
jgi:hypothetical protein